MAIGATPHAAAAIVAIEAAAVHRVGMVELPPGLAQFMRRRTAVAIVAGRRAVTIGPLITMAGIADCF